MFVPLNTKSCGGKYPIWYSRGLIKALREKYKIRIRYRKYKNPLDQLSLKTIKDRCDRLSLQCYNSYIGRAEGLINGNSKCFWSFIKAKQCGTSRYPALMTDGSETVSEGAKICDLLASYFSSVYCNDNAEHISYKENGAMEGECFFWL